MSKPLLERLEKLAAQSMPGFPRDTINDAIEAINGAQGCFSSAHVRLTPWCMCCNAEVPLDHVCSCETELDEILADRGRSA